MHALSPLCVECISLPAVQLLHGLILCMQASPCAWDCDTDAAQEHLLPHPLEHKGVLARTGTLTDDGKVYCKQCKEYVSLQAFEGREVHSGVECCCSAGGALSGAQGDGAGEQQQQQLAAAPGNALPAGSYTILTEEGISLRVSAPTVCLMELFRHLCIAMCHCHDCEMLMMSHQPHTWVAGRSAF
jgi:hypothetical protein